MLQHQLQQQRESLLLQRVQQQLSLGQLRQQQQQQQQECIDLASAGEDSDIYPYMETARDDASSAAVAAAVAAAMAELQRAGVACDQAALTAALTQGVELAGQRRAAAGLKRVRYQV
jgi:mevalonate pyrophosphate decarboxylase